MSNALGLCIQNLDVITVVSHYKCYIFYLKMYINNLKWFKIIGHHGPVSIKNFLLYIYLTIDENLILLSSQFKQSDHYKVLHMTPQLCCGVMCKTVIRWFVMEFQQNWYSIGVE